MVVMGGPYNLNCSCEKISFYKFDAIINYETKIHFTQAIYYA